MGNVWIFWAREVSRAFVGFVNVLGKWGELKLYMLEQEGLNLLGFYIRLQRIDPMN